MSFLPMAPTSLVLEDDLAHHIHFLYQLQQEYSFKADYSVTSIIQTPLATRLIPAYG